MANVTNDQIDACAAIVNELIDELEPAKEAAYKVRRLLGQMPDPLAEDERGETSEMSDALRSIEAARHGLRDIARIAGEWQQDLDDYRSAATRLRDE